MTRWIIAGFAVAVVLVVGALAGAVATVGWLERMFDDEERHAPYRQRQQ